GRCSCGPFVSGQAGPLPRRRSWEFHSAPDAPVEGGGVPVVGFEDGGGGVRRADGALDSGDHAAFVVVPRAEGDAASVARLPKVDHGSVFTHDAAPSSGGCEPDTPAPGSSGSAW